MNQTRAKRARRTPRAQLPHIPARHARLPHNSRRWEDAQFVDGLMCLVKHACGDQTFPFFASLMHHSSVPALTPQQRSIVVKQ
eukprot:29348-Chlamydomonas_euryale.AAC.2